MHGVDTIANKFRWIKKYSSPNISEAPMDKGFQGSKELMKSGKE